MRIAYVLYPDFTALDLVGPYEVISRWSSSMGRSIGNRLRLDGEAEHHPALVVLGDVAVGHPAARIRP